MSAVSNTPAFSPVQCCPTLSPFATCGDRSLKCGDRQLLRNRFVMINKLYFSQILQFIIYEVATERMWLDTTALAICGQWMSIQIFPNLKIVIFKLNSIVIDLGKLGQTCFSNSPQKSQAVLKNTAKIFQLFKTYYFFQFDPKPGWSDLPWSMVQWSVSPPVKRETGVLFPIGEPCFICQRRASPNIQCHTRNYIS